MIKVDKEGIPKIIQKVKYIYENYTFKLTLFNDKTLYIDPDNLIKYYPRLWHTRISREQLMDAYIAAEKRGLEFLYD